MTGVGQTQGSHTYLCRTQSSLGLAFEGGENVAKQKIPRWIPVIVIILEIITRIINISCDGAAAATDLSVGQLIR